MPTPLIVRLAACAATASAALAQCGYQWLPGTGIAGPNGSIPAVLALPGGELLAGGDFDIVDRSYVADLARWNGTAWQAFGGSTTSFARIEALARHPSGDIYVAGAFSTFGGVTTTGIVRFDGTTWQAVGGGISGNVTALCVTQNGDVVAGGQFQSAGGTAASGIARFDGTSWQPLGPGLQIFGVVRAIVERPNGDIVAAGDFQNPQATGVSSWDGTTWTPIGGVGLPNSVSNTLVNLADGTLAIGGNAGVFRWNGTVSTPIGSNVLGDVQAMLLAPNGDLVVGGYFAATGDGLALHVARFDGTTWQAIADGVPNPVLSLTPTLAGGFVAGTAVTSQTQGTVWQFAGSSWQRVSTERPSGPVNDLANAPNGDVYAVGGFEQLGGVTANNIARFDGSAWHPLGLGLDLAASRVAVAPDGSVYASGNFTTAGGAPANRIARFDGNTWSTLGAGLPAAPIDLDVAPDGTLYALLNNTIERWDGTSWSTTVAPAYAFQIAVLPSGVLVAAVLNLGSSVQMWTGSSWIPLGLPSITLQIYALRDGTLLAYGPAQGLQRYDGAAWTPVSVPGIVRDLTELPDGSLAIATNTSIVYRQTGATWTALGGTSAVNIANLASTATGELLVGGNFTQFEGEVRVGLATAAPLCPGDVVAFGSGCVGSSGAVTLAADNLAWAGGSFRSRTQGIPNGAIALQAVGWDLTVAPLPVGAPGCGLFVDAAYFDLLLPSGNTAAAAVPIPDDPALVGQVARTQSLVLELGAGLSLLQTTSSNALQFTIGAL